MVTNIERHIAIGNDIVIYSKTDINREIDLKIRYKINKEEKEIRLYDVPKILTFQEKVMIYYAIIDKYYFYPLSKINSEFNGIEDYVVKENGYSYHAFNGIAEEDNGILGELLFEIPRQEFEPEKLSRIRDIYEMLIRNYEDIGKRPICIAFNGIMPDFKDILKIIVYMFKRDKKLKNKQYNVVIFKRNGILGGNKRIYIVPKDIVEIEKPNIK